MLQGKYFDALKYILHPNVDPEIIEKKDLSQIEKQINDSGQSQRDIRIFRSLRKHGFENWVLENQKLCEAWLK